MVDLTPFVLLHDCPRCGSREIYYPDRVNGSEATFRSFDRRHELKETAWTPELLGDVPYDIGVLHVSGAAPPAPHQPRGGSNGRTDAAAHSPAPNPQEKYSAPTASPPPPIPPLSGSDRQPPALPDARRNGQREGLVFPPAAAPPNARASWGRRAKARLVDSIVYFGLLLFILVVAAIVDPFASQAPDGTEQMSDAAGFTGLFVWIAACVGYEVLGTARFSGTLGKKAFQLEVVRAKSGEPPDTKASVIRAVSASLMLLVPFLNLLNFAWPVWDDEDQALHDKAANTKVKRRERAAR